MVKVSIIIPIYNTKIYLRECLDSMVNQTLREMEIICVDDGSTDGSSSILDEYAAKYANIKVIHQENAGMVAARKRGEAEACGEYIGYMDSDDWAEPDMYEQLYTCASVHKIDLVTSGYYLEGNYTSELLDGVDGGMYPEETIQKLRENMIYDMKRKVPGLRGSRCCKLFSRELLQKLPIPVPNDISLSEDKMQVLAFILECRSAYVIKKAYYHYRINPTSSIHSADPSYLLRVDSVYRYLRKLYPHPNFTASMRQQAELYIMEMLILGINTRLGFETRNLLWFDPYWLEEIPSGSRIVLYGAGEAGRKYRTQLLAKGCHTYVGCVDFEYARLKDDILQIKSPAALAEMNYDFIVITIKNQMKATQIREMLEEQGVEPKRILWFEQRELFWRYAEAEGLLK